MMTPHPARSDDAPTTQTKGSATPTTAASDELQAISGNIGEVNAVTGTGLLGRILGVDKIPGVFLGGAWVADANYLATGGVKPHLWSFNSLILLNVTLDSDQLDRTQF